MVDPIAGKLLGSAGPPSDGVPMGGVRGLLTALALVVGVVVLLVGVGTALRTVLPEAAVPAATVVAVAVVAVAGLYGVVGLADRRSN